MKKIVLLLLSLIMVLSLVACGKKKDDVKDDAGQNNAGQEDTGNEEAKVPDVATLELLTTVWSKIPDDQKPMVWGGDYDNMVDGAAGAVITRDGGSLNSLLAFPADKADAIIEAASVIHMMNANTFTGAAYQFDKADVDDAIKAIDDSIANNHWMCGIPEKYMIAKVGTDVVVAFGAADIVNPFMDKVKECYANAEVVVDKNI